MPRSRRMQLRWSALIAGATFFLYSARAHR